MLTSSLRRSTLVARTTRMNASFLNSSEHITSLHLLAVPHREEKQEQDANRQRYAQVVRREFHSTAKSQSVVALTMLGVAGVAFGGSVLLDSIAKRNAEKAAAAAAAGPAADDTKKAEAAGAAGFGSFFSGFLGAKTFYQGGFEPQMTKREAALILGVRESASREKIREAHRAMSRLNHPDTGGSEYLAMKINEAKDMLLGSK